MWSKSEKFTNWGNLGISMVGNLSSLLAESLISLNVTDRNVSASKVTDDLLPNQTFELYRRDNMTLVGSGSEIEIGELLNSSEKDFLDCGTMPDIVWVKVCSFSLPTSSLVIDHVWWKRAQQKRTKENHFVQSNALSPITFHFHILPIYL